MAPREGEQDVGREATTIHSEHCNVHLLTVISQSKIKYIIRGITRCLSPLRLVILKDFEHLTSSTKPGVFGSCNLKRCLAIALSKGVFGCCCLEGVFDCCCLLLFTRVK